jgi:hypothetical protein
MSAYHGRRPYLLLLSPSGKSGQLCARAFPFKDLESFSLSLSLSLSRRKNYHDPLRSVFVANFKMFHGLMDNPACVCVCVCVCVFIASYCKQE